MSSPAPKRIPLTGSCHCGETKYIIYLTHPHQHAEDAQQYHGKGQRFYRCNCTVCHKTAFFHVRLNSPEEDFVLLAPLDPFTELGDYQCAAKTKHAFYCKTCAVRIFTFTGEGEVSDVEVGEPGRVTRAWRPKKGGRNYLSVNGHTIDGGQEGFEMRDLTEKKLVMYYDCIRDGDEEADPQYERPFSGGCY